MTEFQKEKVEEFLTSIVSCEGHSESEFHHGDCVGVDTEAAEFARRLGYKIHCHPPIKDDLRVFFPHNNMVYEAKSHFARNRSIVDSVDILIVVPYQMEHQTNGGTWYTYDYAKKRKVMTKIFFPRDELLLVDVV